MATGATALPAALPTAHSDLAPFVPRVVVEWAATEPDRVHRSVAGTLVSADISGFTDLSERLAGLGRAGAEEVVAVVNACFEGMIADAVAHGGDVLKFGGDALLILFTGRDHLRRAAVASTLLRHRIARPVAGPTVGVVPLGMSIGVQPGTFELFLVPGGHRELVVVGPDVSLTLAREAAADRGQILLPPAGELPSDADLPDGWLGAPVEGGSPLLVPVDDLPPPPPPPGPSPTVDLSGHVPSSLLATLSTGRRYGEIRPATSAFVAFGDVEEVLATAGPQELARHLTTLVEVVSAACAEYGVHWLDTDVAPDGGKVHLTAGAPTKTRDDDTAMLRALRTIVDTVPCLTLRAGTARGHVFVGDVGAPSRRTFAAMGDSVNLSARLSGRAAPGEVVAAAAVVEAARAAFATEPLPPFRVKGKQAPVHAVVVGHAVRGHASPVPARQRTDLVGRDAEVAAVTTALDGLAAGGRGTVVRVLGRRGLGKSRVVAEALARRGGLPTGWAAGDPIEQSAPYHAILPVLRGLAGIPVGADPVTAGAALEALVARVAPQLEPWLPLLAIPFDAHVRATAESDRVAPAFRRLRLQQAVVDLVREVVTGPAALVLEDVQWFDDASRELARDLLRATDTRPWAIVLTADADPVDLVTGTDGLVVELDRLDDDAARRLLLDVLGDAPVSDHQVARLLERAGGEPQFLTELAAFVAAGGDVAQLPGSVEDAVTTAIDQFAPADRSLLRDAAVVGRVVPLDLLAEVLDDPEVRDADRWAPMGGYVEVLAGGRLRFREHLHHEVAYEGLAYARRRELHVRVAALLARRPDATDQAEDLARHHHLAGSWDASWRWSRLAADRARDRYATVEAAQLYRQALDAAAHLPDLDAAEVAAVHELLGDVAELAGRYEDARQAQQAALDAAADGALVDRARRIRKLATLDERVGDYPSALARCEQALVELDGATGRDAEVARSRVLALAAGVTYRQGEYAACRAHAEAAMASAAGRDRACLARAHYLRALATLDGGLGEDTEDLVTALRIYEEVGDLEGQANAHNNLGVVAYYAGDWDAAVAHYAASRDARRRCGDVIGEAVQLNNLGELWSDQGHHEQAAEALVAARRTFRAAQYSLEPIVDANLGRLATRRGDLDAARDHLDAAAAGFERLDAPHLQADHALREAELAVHAADWGRARTLLAELAAPSAAGAGDLSLEVNRRALLGLVHAHTGEVDLAVGELLEAEGGARRLGTGHELLRVLHALAWVQARYGVPAGEWVAEAAATAAALGVVAVPLVPTPRPARTPQPEPHPDHTDPPDDAPTAHADPEGGDLHEVARLLRGLVAGTPAEVEVTATSLHARSPDPVPLLRALQHLLAVVASDPTVPRVRVELVVDPTGAGRASATVTVP